MANHGIDRATMFLGGLLVGVGMGLLFAPQPGAKVRRQISRQATRYAKSAKKEFLGRADDLLEKGREAVGTAAERGKEILEAGADNLKDVAKKAAGNIVDRIT